MDKKEIQAKKGATLLQACLENDIYIPNLCYLDDMKEPPASCRLCFVEMDGEGKPIASCTLQVKAGMIIRTDTPAVRRLQRAALQFLLSAHDVDCGPCPANKKCDLQHMSKFLKVGLKPKHLEKPSRCRSWMKTILAWYFILIGVSSAENVCMCAGDDRRDPI